MRKIHSYLKTNHWAVKEDTTGITVYRNGVEIKIYKLYNPRGFHLYIKTSIHSYGKICDNSDDVISTIKLETQLF